MGQYVPLGLHLYLSLFFLLTPTLCHEARRQGERDLSGPFTQRQNGSSAACRKSVLSTQTYTSACLISSESLSPVAHVSAGL